MAFMAPEAQNGNWWLITGKYTSFVVEEEFAADNINELLGEKRNIQMEFLGSGWSARFNAAGYLDCTDWIAEVFKTEEEALFELFLSFDSANESFDEWAEEYDLEWMIDWAKENHPDYFDWESNRA